MSLPFAGSSSNSKGIAPLPAHGAKSTCFVGSILAASTVDCGFHPLIGAIPTPQSIDVCFQSSTAGATFSRKRSQPCKSAFPVSTRELAPLLRHLLNPSRRT